MKKYILLLNITICFLYILTLNSCSLDENLYGMATTDRFVQNEEDAKFVVNGVYANLQTFESFKSSTSSLIMFSGDDFTSSNVTTSNIGGFWINRNFTSSTPYIRNVWNSLFSVINRANSARETIDDVSTIDLEVRSKINGEMTFLRGFSYFNLVRLFGEVPLFLSATKPTDDLNRTRQPIDSVYALIFTDFKNANEKCVSYSEQPPSEFGRATKGAAQAMLSLAYLTYANYLDMNGKVDDAQIYYQYAVNWADSVILSYEYQLLDNYADLFDVEKEKYAYDEVIFGIQFTRDNTRSGAASKGSEWPTYTQPTERWGISGNLLPMGRGSSQIKLQPWFVEQYFIGDYENDYRAEVSFLTSWDGYTTAGVPKKYVTFPIIAPDDPDLVRQPQAFLDKYKDPKGLDNRNHENDFYIIRLSEVYLIKAEALNELGRTFEAYIPFNELRNRARNADGNIRSTPKDLTPGLNKEDFRLAVFNERGLELVGEGHRFFDAVRMRYPNSNKSMLQWRFDTFYPEMPAIQKTLPVWNKNTMAWVGGRVYMLNVVPWHERLLLFPIPSSELDANPEFGIQNPGW
jgi:hypothetical protein